MKRCLSFITNWLWKICHISGNSSDPLDSLEETLYHLRQLITEGTDGRPGPFSVQSGIESHRAF